MDVRDVHSLENQGSIHKPGGPQTESPSWMKEKLNQASLDSSPGWW